jgi:hypothetical protein
MEARTTIARAAEGLDFSTDEFESVYLDVMADPSTVVALNPLKADGTPQDYDKIIYSTPQMLASEHRVATAVRHKSKAAFPAVTQATAAAVLESHAHLDAEQRKAYAAITHGRGLVMLEGPAGTGKTSVVRPAIEALRKDKRIDRVVVVSTAGRTAIDTGVKLGADAAGSIDRIVREVAAGKLKIDNRTLVVIDEAAMVDTARMKQISESLGAGRWVMTGDPHQMQPVGPGGWYQDAQGAHPTSIYRLSEVHRHIDPEDTLAYNALHEGRSGEFLDSMERRGRLHIDSTEQDSWDRITRNYAADLDAGHSARDVRIIAAGGANRELDSWNRAVQKMRIDRGEIAPEGFSMVATRTNRSWEVHSGDVVMFLANHRGPDGTHLQNGVVGIARSVDPQTGKATLDLHDGRTVTLDLQATAEIQPVVPAYAVHSAKFQGGQTKITHQVTPRPENIDAFAAYVATTRAEVATHLYLNAETHGEQAKANVAEALQRRVFPQTARSLDQRETPAQPVAPPPVAPPPVAPPPVAPPVSAVATVRRANQAWAAEMRRAEQARSQALAPHIQRAREGLRLSALRPVVGPSVTKQVEASPAWKQLNEKLDKLEAQGLDDRAMLVTAARQPGLSIASDPAADLTDRLDSVEPAKRSATGPVTLEPAVPWLVGPADRGPTPRRRDEDRAGEIAEFGAGGRRGPALPPVPPLHNRPKAPSPPPPAPPGYQPKTSIEQPQTAHLSPPPPRRERPAHNETHDERLARLLGDSQGPNQAPTRARTHQQQEHRPGHDREDRRGPDTGRTPPPPPRRERPTHEETPADRAARLLRDYQRLNEALDRDGPHPPEHRNGRERDDGIGIER